MAQHDGASPDELVPKSIELKTNDVPVRFTNHAFHKYAVKVHPKPITAKEKRFLAKEFVARLKLNRKSSTVVQIGDFGFLFPEPQPELERTFFCVIHISQKESFDGAARDGKFYIKFLTCELRTCSFDRRLRHFEFDCDDTGLQLFTVYLEKGNVRLDSISTLEPQVGMADPGLRKQQAVTLTRWTAYFSG